MLNIITESLSECRKIVLHPANAGSYAIIDSQSVKTGPDARGDTGFDAGKKIKGRKRHILVDTLGMILKTEVHSAGIQDITDAASHTLGDDHLAICLVREVLNYPWPIGFDESPDDTDEAIFYPC